MTLSVIALGSNLGDRLGNLHAAVSRLNEHGILVRDRSGVWETPPVPAGQPPYLNAVVTAETALEPPELLRILKQVEDALGRRPERRWGPRPIDLDILFYGSEHVALPGLDIPHVRILERAFVLAPLSDIWGGPLPVLGVSPLDALEALQLSGIRRVAGL